LSFAAVSRFPNALETHFCKLLMVTSVLIVTFQIGLMTRS